MLYLGDSYAFLRLILEKVSLSLVFILEKVYPLSEIRQMSGVI